MRIQMNYLHKLYNFTTIEEGKENVKKALELRDSMGGNLYWNICNDDYLEIKKKLTDMEAEEFLKNRSK